MLLNDTAIIDAVCNHQMIDPFTPKTIREDENGQRIISRGLSSAGYDICALPKWKLFKNTNAQVIDPKSFDPRIYDVSEAQVLNLPPMTYALCESVEHFNIPSDISAICIAKSTYARCGLQVNVTPLEPGWSGKLVLEIFNSAPLPIKVYANEGLAKILFFRLDGTPHADYHQCGGRYQDQKGIQDARI